jgi:hypothetical protein
VSLDENLLAIYKEKIYFNAIAFLLFSKRVFIDYHYFLLFDKRGMNGKKLLTLNWG